MNTTIILIGPMSAGKSTLAALLSERLGLQRIEMDDIRWDYYAEIGYDPQVATRLAESDEGMMALIKHWKPFEAHAVVRALQEHSGCVLDFGAGHSVFEDEELLEQVEEALAPFPHVFLILPSPDPDKSVEILNRRFRQLLEREVGHVDERLMNLNQHFVRHPSNQRLAKHVIYTEGKTPEETVVEMMRLISGQALDYNTR
jgi:shikimate kinase